MRPTPSQTRGVTTRCLSARNAIIMSAFFNFLGVFIMTRSTAPWPPPSAIWWTSETAPRTRWSPSARPCSPSLYTAWGHPLRDPHQREPQPHRRSFGSGHRHPARHRRHQRGRVGRGPLRPCAEPGAGLRHRLGGYVRSSPSSAGTWTGAGPTGSSALPRSPEPRP